MSMIRIASSTVLVAASVIAVVGLAQAQDKKPAPAAAAAPKPAAAPAPVAAAPAAAPAKAAPPAPSGSPPAPAPSKELAAFMKGFEGSWKCDTKFAAGAMGPGSPESSSKSTVKFKKEYGGFSWHGEYSIAKSKTMPGMSGEMQLAFDPGSNQITSVGHDSMGGATFGAGPISGDTAVINEDGYMMGMKVKLRDTMTKKGPKEVYHKFEVDMGKGLQVVGEDSCKK
jgi:Protein of unknown function (DUF1579)